MTWRMRSNAVFMVMAQGAGIPPVNNPTFGLRL